MTLFLTATIMEMEAKRLMTIRQYTSILMNLILMITKILLIITMLNIKDILMKG